MWSGHRHYRISIQIVTTSALSGCETLTWSALTGYARFLPLSKLFIDQVNIN